MASAPTLLGFLLLASAAVAVTVAGSPAAQATGQHGSPSAAADLASGQDDPAGLLAPASVDPDRVLLEIQVHEDGDASWTVEYRVALADENATAAFESTRAEIEADPESYRSRFAEGIGESVATARNRTGREMAVEDVQVEAEREQVPEETGVVRYRFRWTAFATDEGDALVAGDAIDRLFLNERTLLEVVAPEGWTVEDVSPAADRRDDRSVEWEGTRNFAEGEPRVRLAPSDSESGATGAGDGGVPLPDPLLVVAAFGGVAMVAGGGWLLRRSGADAGPERSYDEPLLSNEERVRRLLEARGGRVKQRTVAETLEWSDSKTSKVVDALHEAGEVDRYRLGRENVLVAPDRDLADTEEVDDDA